MCSVHGLETFDISRTHLSLLSTFAHASMGKTTLKNLVVEKMRREGISAIQQSKKRQ